MFSFRPSLKRAEVARANTLGSDASRIFSLEQQLVLQQLNAFDLRLYRVCRQVLRQVANRWLFHSVIPGNHTRKKRTRMSHQKKIISPHGSRWK